MPPWMRQPAEGRAGQVGPEAGQDAESQGHPGCSQEHRGKHGAREKNGAWQECDGAEGPILSAGGLGGMELACGPTTGFLWLPLG